MDLPIIQLSPSASNYLAGSGTASLWVVQATKVFRASFDGALEYVTSLRMEYRCLSIARDFQGANLYFLLKSESGRAFTLCRLSSLGKCEYRDLYLPSDPIRVVLSPHGDIFVLLIDHSITRAEFLTGTTSACVEFEQPISDLSVGADGRFWAVLTQHRYGGFVVANRDAHSMGWFMLPAPASATRVAAAPDGSSWTLNDKGQIWRLHPRGGGNFIECQVDTACARCLVGDLCDVFDDLTVSPDGTLWFSKVRDGLTTITWLQRYSPREYKSLTIEGSIVFCGG